MQGGQPSFDKQDKLDNEGNLKYRIISLLPFTGTVLERLILDRLRDGGIKRRSTQDALERLKYEVDMAETKYVAAIFLDISAALIQCHTTKFSMPWVRMDAQLNYSI